MKLFAVFAWALAVVACGAVDESASVRKEAPDEWNQTLEKQLDRLSYRDLSLTSGYMQRRQVKPWSDSYWPYFRTGLAYRYQNDAVFSSLQEQLDSMPESQSLQWSPAEKFDKLRQQLEGLSSFPLTAYFWGRHDYYRESFVDRPGEWHWMGVCSGWAPASLNEVPPKYAVVVPHAENPIVFYPGDLRALLSAAYDVNKRNGRFRTIGLRCNMEHTDVIRDDRGRPVDGSGESGENPFRIVRDERVNGGWFEAYLLPDGPTLFYHHAEGQRGFLETGIYHSFTTIEALQSALESGSLSLENSQSLQFFHNCRDLNPAALISSLYEQFKDPSNVQLIAEISGSHQVWNFPVWGYQLTLGSPRLVSTLPMNQRSNYAAQTLYVVDAEIFLDHASGVTPAVSYADAAGDLLTDFAYSRRKAYGVELEFDAAGHLRGGEWVRHDNDTVIDFLWSYHGGVEDVSVSDGTAVLPYNLIAALRDCSLREPNAEVALGTSGETLPAVECLL